MPHGEGQANPLQLLGTYADSGLGTKTIGVVGSDSFTVVGGGLVAGAHRGAVVRRLTGAGWRRYFVTDNTATTIICALPWVNGATPVAGDTFRIENAATELRWTSSIMDMNGGIVIADGILFSATGGGLKRLIWTNGALYTPGCRVYANLGRFGFDGAVCRTVDLIEETFDGISRYPTEMPDQLGLFVSAGDFFVAGTGKSTLVLATGSLSFQADGLFPPAPSANIDITARSASSIVFLDSNISSDSAMNASLDGDITLTRSDIVNSRSRLTTTNGGNRAFDNGTINLVSTDVHDCTKVAGLADGILADTGGIVLLSDCTTSGGNTGYGVRCQRGGDLINTSGGGTNSITGALGEIGIEVPGLGSTPITWAQFDARLGTSRRNGFLTKPAAEGYLGNNRALQSLVENLSTLELVTNSTTADIDAASVDGLVAWWLPASGRTMTVGAATVEVWKDRTYNEWQPNQPAATAPTFVARAAEVANEAALDFDGANDRLFLSSDFTPLSTTAYTMFYVSRVDTPASTNYLFRESAALAAVQDTNIRYQYVGGGEGHYANVTATPLIVHAVYDGTLVGDANRLKVYESNVQQVLTFGAAIPASISGTGDLTVGAFDDVPNFPFNGRFYEIIIYNRALTTAEQLLIYNYLKNKFGL